MLFFLSCLLSIMSLVGMENDNSLVPLVGRSAVYSLKDLALYKICNFLIYKKISMKQFNLLPRDLREGIHEGITESSKVKTLTPTVTKEYFFHTLTPDHRFMLVLDKDPKGCCSLLDINTKKEMPIDVASKERESPMLISLSFSGNEVACAAIKKIWVKDILNKEIKAEINWKAPFPNNMIFIDDDNLVIKDKNNHTRCLSIKEDLAEKPVTNFPFLGVLRTKSEYLTRNGTTELGILRFKTDGISYSLIPCGGEFFRMQPAIYEPDMIMAYEQDYPKSVIHVISLEKNREEDILLAKLESGVAVTAFSFANQGKWLVLAHEQNMAYQDISIWDWRLKQKMFTLPLNRGSINEISYTDLSSNHPCILECTDPNVSKCLLSCDPIKLVTADIMKKYNKNIINTKMRCIGKFMKARGL